MTESETAPHHPRIQSRFDLKWLILFGFGLMLSVAYYIAVLWAAIRLVRLVVAWLHA